MFTLILWLWLGNVAGAPASLPRSCNATQSTIDGKNYWWHVRVMDGAGKPKLYSIRPGNESGKAINDCKKWLKSQEKKGNGRSSK